MAEVAPSGDVCGGRKDKDWRPMSEGVVGQEVGGVLGAEAEAKK